MSGPSWHSMFSVSGRDVNDHRETQQWALFDTKRSLERYRDVNNLNEIHQWALLILFVL